MNSLVRAQQAGSTSVRCRLCVHRGTWLALLMVMTGCTAWHSKPVLVPTDVVTYHEAPVRVQLRDGRRLMLADVRIFRDTLFASEPPTAPDTVAVVHRIHVAAIESVAVRESSPQRTVGAMVAGLFVGMLMFGYMMLGGG